MSATRKQIGLIEELQTRGASIPAKDNGDPDFSMYNSVADADKYIKQWCHLMGKWRTSLRADEWGGIPNC